MDQQQTLIALGVSALIGGIIGLEREKTKQNNNTNTLIGIRTDILICLFGAISALFSKLIGNFIFYLLFAGLFLFTLIPYTYHCFTEKKVSLKNEISTIIVFLLGALTMFGSIQTAIEITILTVGALSLKNILHKAVYNIEYKEIIDAVKFALIAFIVLPFLPDQSYDKTILPYLIPNIQSSPALENLDVLNPYRIWLIVVVISGINFLGYILVKVLGKHRGLAITGMIGGLYSSTITSLTLAEKSKSTPQVKSPFIAGITLACSLSFIKMFVLLHTLNSQLFERTFVSMGIMSLYLLITGLIVMKVGKKEKESNRQSKLQYKIENSPFKLSQAIKLGSILVITLLIANLVLAFANINFYYILAGLMAFFAVDDPIIISTSEIAGKIISFTDAKNIIVSVIFLNLIQKVATMYFFGNRKLVKPLSFIFGGLFLVTIISFLYL